jgi:hypothetical protein
VILYRFDRQPLEAIVDSGALLQEEGVEFITLDGNLQKAAYKHCKAVCFTVEGARADLFSEHKEFETRPKTPGLWVRFIFRDEDRLDGILPHNLLHWPETGYWITPPRATSTRQRVYIPRAALIHTEVRGVIGRPSAVDAKPKLQPGPSQLSIFDS